MFEIEIVNKISINRLCNCYSNMYRSYTNTKTGFGRLSLLSFQALCPSPPATFIAVYQDLQAFFTPLPQCIPKFYTPLENPLKKGLKLLMKPFERPFYSKALSNALFKQDYFFDKKDFLKDAKIRNLALKTQRPFSYLAMPEGLTTQILLYSILCVSTLENTLFEIFLFLLRFTFSKFRLENSNYVKEKI